MVGETSFYCHCCSDSGRQHKRNFYLVNYDFVRTIFWLNSCDISCMRAGLCERSGAFNGLMNHLKLLFLAKCAFQKCNDSTDSTDNRKKARNETTLINADKKGNFCRVFNGFLLCFKWHLQHLKSDNEH